METADHESAGRARLLSTTGGRIYWVRFLHNRLMACHCYARQKFGSCRALLLDDRKTSARTLKKRLGRWCEDGLKNISHVQQGTELKNSLP